LQLKKKNNGSEAIKDKPEKIKAICFCKISKREGIKDIIIAPAKGKNVIILINGKVPN